jgi:hypothetical protein
MLKYKVNKAHAFVIGRYRPDNLLDALIVGYQGGRLLAASKVRNRFVPYTLRDVEQAEGLETTVGPCC